MRNSDLLGSKEADALATANEHVKAMMSAMKDAGTVRTDVRPLLVSALHALDVGDPGFALQLGDQAQQGKLVLPPWQRDLLGDKLAPLRSLLPWQAIVGAGP